MKDVICKVIVMQAVIVWIFCACGLSRSSNFEGSRESGMVCHTTRNWNVV